MSEKSEDAMKRKAKISQREKNRRDEQRHAAWKKEHPNEAHAIRMLRNHPVEQYLYRSHIEMYRCAAFP